DRTRNGDPVVAATYEEEAEIPEPDMPGECEAAFRYFSGEGRQKSCPQLSSGPVPPRQSIIKWANALIAAAGAFLVGDRPKSLMSQQANTLLDRIGRILAAWLRTESSG